MNVSKMHMTSVVSKLHKTISLIKQKPSRTSAALEVNYRNRSLSLKACTSCVLLHKVIALGFSCCEDSRQDKFESSERCNMLNKCARNVFKIRDVINCCVVFIRDRNSFGP
jgi:hypothetical protein